MSAATATTTSDADTRSRLLAAALAEFGRHDFGAVSVRTIVQDAGANIAAVSYHFGGKQGLYLATAEFLAAELRGRLAPLLARAAESRDGAEAIALLRELIEGLLGILLSSGFGEHAAGFILREQARPTAAFDVLYERLMLPMQQVFQHLAVQIAGTNAGDQRRQILVTHALMGQILAYRVARTTVLRRLGQRDFSKADRQDIAGLITELCIAALRGGVPGSNDR